MGGIGGHPRRPTGHESRISNSRRVLLTVPLQQAVVRALQAWALGSMAQQRAETEGEHEAKPQTLRGPRRIQTGLPCSRMFVGTVADKDGRMCRDGTQRARFIEVPHTHGR